jgi:hypothetical protein
MEGVNQYTLPYMKCGLLHAWLPILPLINMILDLEVRTKRFARNNTKIKSEFKCEIQMESIHSKMERLLNERKN